MDDAALRNTIQTKLEQQGEYDRCEASASRLPRRRATPQLALRDPAP